MQGVLSLPLIPLENPFSVLGLETKSILWFFSASRLTLSHQLPYTTSRRCPPTFTHPTCLPGFLVTRLFLLCSRPLTGAPDEPTQVADRKVDREVHGSKQLDKEQVPTQQTGNECDATRGML